MGDEVDLQVARHRVAVVREGADGDLLARPACGGIYCLGRMPTSDRQRRQLHLEDALPDHRIEVEVPVPLQGGDQAGQDRLEAAAANAIGGFPAGDRRLYAAPRRRHAAPGRGCRERGDRPSAASSRMACLRRRPATGDGLVEEDLALAGLGDLPANAGRRLSNVSPPRLCLLISSCIDLCLLEVVTLPRGNDRLSVTELMRQCSALGNQTGEATRRVRIVGVDREF